MANICLYLLLILLTVAQATLCISSKYSRCTCSIMDDIILLDENDYPVGSRQALPASKKVKIDDRKIRDVTNVFYNRYYMCALFLLLRCTWGIAKGHTSKKTPLYLSPWSALWLSLTVSFQSFL